MEFKFLFYIFFVASVAAKQDTSNIEAYKQNYAKNRAIDDFIADESLPGEACVDGDINGICVPYHQCTTGVVNEEGETDGFGVIDIRFDRDKPCSNYMDKCCEIPKAGFKNPSTSIGSSEESDTLPPPFTGRPQGTTPGPIVLIPKPVPSYCGIRNEYGIDFKIMGNNDNEAEYGEFPWVVAIIKPGRDPKFLCGGSLLTPNVVLTGAHCVKQYETIPDDIKIRAGEWDSQTTRERLPFQERDVTKIIIHENYSEGNLFNDVALLILSPSVMKADNVGTICLPSQGMNINSRDCFVSGWGKDVFGQRGRYQSILKKIQLPTVPRDKCQNDLRNTRLGRKFALHDSFTCAGGEMGRDACTGDGGSPLVCPDPHNKTRYLQVGIVAWGIGCGQKDVPGVYADVAKFRTWIDAHMEKLEIDTLPYNN